jgi:hypothetical protein
MSCRRGSVIVLAVVIVCVSVLVPRQASCRLNLPEIGAQTVIEGQSHQVLGEHFDRLAAGSAREPSGGQAATVLVQALPDAYRSGCGEMVRRWGPAAEGTAGMSVRVLYVEPKSEGRPVRALLAYACYSTAPGQGPSQARDERLAALVVGPRAARLTMLPDDSDREDCPTLTRIHPDKEVHIGGKSVVGLSFLKSNKNPCCAPAGDTEERINFYLVKDDAIGEAGSVLKARERHGDDGKTVYSAGVVFKKDMKGNIVGILSPYKVKNPRWSDRGMVRYRWRGETEGFVKE